MVDKRLLSYSSILINSLPIIIIPIWANLITYVKSYYYYSLHFTTADVQVVVVIFALATNISFYCLQLIIQYYNNKQSLLVLNIITALCYFMIPRCINLFSFYLLFLLLTTAQRTTLNIINHISVDLFMKNKSFVIGANLSSSSIAAIVWSILLTYIINPDNDKVDQLGNLPKEVAEGLVYYTNGLTVFTLLCGVAAYYLMNDVVCFDRIDRNTANTSSSIFKQSASIKTATFITNNKSGIELQESMMEDKNLPNFNYEKSNNLSSFQIESNSKDYNNDDNFKSLNFNKPLHRQTTYSPINSIDEEKNEKEYPEEQVLKNSLYTFSNSKASINIKETTILRNYILTRTFMVIWLSSFCRNTFNIYIKNNFKTISLYSINDDKFINGVSSATLGVMLVAQLFSGTLIDRIGPFIVTIIVYASSLVIIGVYIFSPTSRPLFVVAIIFNRIINGINVILNNSLLYGLYSRAIVVKLLKYFFINSLISSIVTIVAEAILINGVDFTRVWVFYLLLTMLACLLLMIEMKRFSIK